MRQVKASDFASAHEFEAAKRQQRKADKAKRQSPLGRGNFQFQPVAPATGCEE
ncbi:hypothetical protein vBPFY1MI_100 [Pseudomonas phage vB_PF_Y1-MI]|nr:hypothetical protein vBPFY1MI_100 [Pseudomonas phage vB_PF_Y1-MI]